MSYCYEKGIPHSEFLGWSDEDRAKTLAYALEAAERCTLCGTAPWEWKENRFAYAPEEHRCHGCYVKQTYAESINSLPGTTVRLVPNTPQRRAQQEIAERKRRSRKKE